MRVLPKKVQKKKLAIHHRRFILGTAAVAVVLVLVYVLLGLKDLVGQATVTEGAACEHGKFYLSDADGDGVYDKLELCNCVGSSCAKGSCQGAECVKNRMVTINTNGGRVMVGGSLYTEPRSLEVGTLLVLSVQSQEIGADGATLLFSGWGDNVAKETTSRQVVVVKDESYTTYWCGNGMKESTEECDGAEGLVCPAGTSGPPVCTTACRIDTSPCQQLPQITFTVTVDKAGGSTPYESGRLATAKNELANAGFSCSTAYSSTGSTIAHICTSVCAAGVACTKNLVLVGPLSSNYALYPPYYFQATVDSSTKTFAAFELKRSTGAGQEVVRSGYCDLRHCSINLYYHPYGAGREYYLEAQVN